MMAQRKSGTPSPTRHLIPTMENIHTLNRLHVEVVKHVEVAGREDDLQAGRVEDEVRILMVNLWQ